MRLATAGVALLLLAGGCANGVQTASQTSEKALIEANDLYVAIASTSNAYEALPVATADQKAKLESVKRQAYSDLLIARAAYSAGQIVSVAALLADQALAKQTTGAN